MKLLELFSGTHSIGKVAEKKGYEVWSVDKELGAECPFGSGYKSKHHIKKDIFDWNYKEYPVGYFDVITASPVCLYWSNLRNTWIGRKLKGMTRNLTREDIQNDIDKYGKPMVDKVFEIIEYFKPKYYWIENPATGKMRHYVDSKTPNKYIFSYCHYSDWGYRKDTAFWCNIKGVNAKKCKKDCKNIVEIKTQKGATHKGYKTPIKGKTRTIHIKQIGDKKFKDGVKSGANPQKVHKTRMGTSKRVIVDGKVISCNSKELRKRYRHMKDVSKDLGGGTNRLGRYRIPTGVIEELLSKCIFENKTEI